MKFYSPGGRFLGRFGSLGEGPGEFRQVADLYVEPSGDYLFFDASSSRLSRFSPPPALEFRASCRLEIGAVNRARLSDGSFVVNAVTAASVANGHVLHIVDREGEVARSFGGVREALDLRHGDHELRRILAVGPGDRIWSGRPNEYRVDSFNRGGDLLGSFRRDAPWFRPHDDPRIRVDNRAGAPNPKLRNLHVDRSGLLWSVVWVASPDWRNSVTGLEGAIPTIDLDLQYDTMIEAIDPEQGVVVARLRVPMAVSGVVTNSNAVFYHMHREEDGSPSLSIYRATLSRKPM